MLTIAMICIFLCVSLFVMSFSPVGKEARPSLNLRDLGLLPAAPVKKERKKFDPVEVFNQASSVIKPIVTGDLRQRLVRDLAIARTVVTPELFLLIKLGLVLGLMFFFWKVTPVDLKFLAIVGAILVGYMGPEIILKGRIAEIKSQMVKDLPDTVDLLGLCVNAGLDFMMALKWVVDKSVPNYIVQEMDNILQEISVGKPRRDALRDLAKRYDLPDLSTFARTLIQADKMGTSISDALNMLSEDMRLARYRRGEAMAMKAPLKMLVPLLFFIFPVVFILVGAPIFLDFILNSPMKKLGM